MLSSSGIKKMLSAAESDESGEYRETTLVSLDLSNVIPRRFYDIMEMAHLGLDFV